MKSLAQSFTLAALALLALAPAQAQNFNGKTVEYRYLYPDTSITYEGPTNLLVGPGSDGLILDNRVPLDISANVITIDFSPLGPTTFTSSSFNGVSFFDVFASIDPITSVTVSASNTLVGFDNSRIFFDADTVRLNFASLSFNANTSFFSVDVMFGGAAVPEPGSVALLVGAGIGGVMLRRRKK